MPQPGNGRVIEGEFACIVLQVPPARKESSPFRHRIRTAWPELLPSTENLPETDLCDPVPPPAAERPVQGVPRTGH